MTNEYVFNIPGGEKRLMKYYLCFKHIDNVEDKHVDFQ